MLQGGLFHLQRQPTHIRESIYREHNSSKISLDDLKRMSIEELKNLLIAQIKVIDNRILLEALHRLLELEGLKSNVYVLSGAQRNAINEGREQIKNGEYLTDDQADKDIEEWLRG